MTTTYKTTNTAIRSLTRQAVTISYCYNQLLLQPTTAQQYLHANRPQDAQRALGSAVLLNGGFTASFGDVHSGESFGNRGMNAYTCVHVVLCYAHAHR